jgi:ABC-type transport system involved in multi-copper enzyme maturation permease subunit
MNTITTSHVIDTVDAGPPIERRRLGHAVTQWSVTKAEWIKLRSVRVNVFGIAAAAVGLVLLGVLFSAVGNTDQGPRGTVADSVSLVFGGITLSQLIIGVLAALFVGSEYASGLIRTTFGAVGRRTRVLRAKAIVFGVVTWLAMTIGAFGAFFAGSAVYGGDLASYSIADPGVLRAVLSAGFYGGCVALIGIAVGFLLRSTAAAIGVLLGLLMLAPVLVGLLPGTVGDTLTKILPSKAGDAMMSVASPDSLLSPWLGFAVLVAWAVGLLAIAALALRRRDA